MKGWRRLFARRPLAAAGLVALACVVALSVAAPAFPGLNPQTMNIARRLHRPAPGLWLGTDEFGRDILARVVHGTRLSLLVGATVTVFCVAAGGMVGLAAGYFRHLDNLLMRIMDGFMAFPSVILAIALMAALGPSVVNVIVALGVTYTPRMARVVRSSVLVVRELDYAQAAVAIGCPTGRVLFRHVLPNCVSPMTVQATFTFAYAVLGEALLSFLGVGVPPYVPSLGTMLSAGRVYIQVAPWMTIFPGLMVFVVVLALNLIGDTLRDALDRRLQKVI